MTPNAPSRTVRSALVRALRTPQSASLFRDLVAAAVVFGGIAFMAML